MIVSGISYRGASLIAQLVKNPTAMQETLVWFWARKIPWKKDRLPTPVFLGFPCGLAGKESACNEGDLGSIPGLGRSPGEGKDVTPVFWNGQFHGATRIKHDWVTFSFTLERSWIKTRELIFIFYIPFTLFLFHWYLKKFFCLFLI